MNDNRSKVRRVRVVTRKWSMEEEQEILHYIKRYLDNLQLPDDGPVRSKHLKSPKQKRNEIQLRVFFNFPENLGMSFLRKNVVGREIRCHIAKSNAKQSSKSAAKIFEGG